MKYLLIPIFVFTLLAGAKAQEETQNIQPSIMVVPYTKESEDIRTILDEDPNKRISMAEVKKGFDERGFTTIDFKGKLIAAKNTAVIEGENQLSLKQQIIENSGADIYVEVDYILTSSPSGSQVDLVLQGYDAFSGQSISNATGRSRIFRTDKIGILASQASEACLTDFLDVMNIKFGEIVKNGRTVVVNIGISEESEVTMDTEVGDDFFILSDLLEEWFENNAYKGYFHIQGITGTKMILDDVRIPLKDRSGNNYRPTKFASQLYRFIRKDLELGCTRTVNGTSIYLTLN